MMKKLIKGFGYCVFALMLSGVSVLTANAEEDVVACVILKSQAEVKVGKPFATGFYGIHTKSSMLTVHYDGVPEGASILPSGGNSNNQYIYGALSWTPTAADVGSHLVTLYFVDKSDNDASCTLTINVVDNQPPVCDLSLTSSGPLQCGQQEFVSYLNGGGSYDPEGSLLSYDWSYSCPDLDANQVVFECDRLGCPADLNGDGHIDFKDLSILLAKWGSIDCEEYEANNSSKCPDINADGVVDVFDLRILLDWWTSYGAVCPQEDVCGSTSSLTLYPESDDVPAQCNVTLTVFDGKDSSSCSTTVNVTGAEGETDQCGKFCGSDACLDCAGNPFGTAQIDACGVCGGSNDSCSGPLTCADINEEGIDPLRFEMTEGLYDMTFRCIRSGRQLVRHGTRLLPNFRGARRLGARHARRECTNMFAEGWQSIWSLPSAITECIGDNCTEIDNTELLQSFQNTSLNIAKAQRLMTRRLVRILRRNREAYSPQLIRRVVKHARARRLSSNRQHGNNLEVSALIPPKSSSCQ